MKKFLLISALCLLVGLAYGSDQLIDYNKLPKAARSFVRDHFDSLKVVRSTVDRELFGNEYTVYLEGGVKIEFNKKGAWTQIDCGTRAVPSAIVLPAISTYVSTNYAGLQIVELDKDQLDYELSLSNGVELKFDLAGNFLLRED